MKKNIILYLAVVFALVLQFNIDCFADNTPDMEIGDQDFYNASRSSVANSYFPSTFSKSLIPDSVVDNIGHYTKGSLVVNDTQYSVDWILGNQWVDSTFSKPCKYMFVLVDRSTTPIKYYICWSNYQDETYSKVMGMCSYGSAAENNIWRGYLLGQSNSYVSNSNLYYIAQYNVVGNFVSCNLPIFAIDDSTSIENYIENGSINGAENKDDLQPKAVVPQPFFASGQGLDSASRNQNLTPYFTDNMKFTWSPGSNANYNYENMGFEVFARLQIVYKDSDGNDHPVTCDSNVYRSFYGSNTPYAEWSATALNGVLHNGIDDVIAQRFGLNGYIVSASIYIKNFDRADSNNKSAQVYGKYNFLNKNWSTNNNSNDNNDSTEESTEDIVDSPNQVQSGDNNNNSSSSSQSGNSSASVSLTNNNNPTNNNDPTFTNDPTFNNDPTFSPTYNGNTVTNSPSFEGNTVTNNPTYNGNTVTISNSKGFWDLIGDLIASDREDKESIINGIADTVKAIPTLLDTLNTFIGGEEDQEGHPTGGINGLLESLQATATSFSSAYTTLISGITSVVSTIGTFASSIVNTISGTFDDMFDSVNGVLTAGSSLGQYVTSGFGLLGNNGYISLFSGFFEFVPSEIWSIITLAVSSSASLLITSSIVKFLHR